MKVGVESWFRFITAEAAKQVSQGDVAAAAASGSQHLGVAKALGGDAKQLLGAITDI